MTRTRNFVIASLVALLAVTNSFAQTVNLPGTTWHGKEDLGGFGKLTFKFDATGNGVTMIDEQATRPGSYIVDQGKLILDFPQAKCTYVGVLKGYTLVGKAVNDAKTSWNWEVSLADAPKQAPILPKNDTTNTTNTTTNTTKKKNGPGSGPGVGPGQGQGQQPQPGKITIETVVDALKKQNFSPEMVTPEVGAPYALLNVKDNAGWTFSIEVRVDNTGVWLNAPLDQLPENASPAHLIRLLEASNATAPCFFAYRAADRRIMLKLEVMNVQQIGRDLQMLQNTIKNSHDLWNTEKWN